MSHGPEPAGGGEVGGPDVGGVDVGGVVTAWCHCWLLPPLQDHRISLVPLAVAAALASRHSPDCTPVIVPLELKFHCWLVCPLQSQMMTCVPLVVPRPLASRHLLPNICSWLPDVNVHAWPAWPPQS